MNTPGIQMDDTDTAREVEVGYMNGKRTVYVGVHHVVKFRDTYRLTFMSNVDEDIAERISLPDREIKYVHTGKLVGMRQDNRIGCEGE